MNQAGLKVFRMVGGVLAALALAATNNAFAHGEKKEQGKKAPAVKKEQKDWGIAGNGKSVRRTVTVEMLDSMRFSPDQLTIKTGETVRFVVRNAGKVMHEFVIGTKKENEQHAALMVKFPNMEHDEPYMAHVAPGKSGDIIWQFNRPGEFEFACLIAGHYSRGMVGRIKVVNL
ncbi:MAG: hypothetical protein RL341_2504 [Pseudomonadota bacterium]